MYGVGVTREVLESAAFRAALVRVDTMSRGVWRSTVSGLEFAQQFLQDSDEYNVGPTTYQVDPEQTANAATGWSVRDQAMHISFNVNVLDRLAAGQSLASLACAVDTIAHEEVHTIWRADDSTPSSVYTDRGHHVALTPLASYTVGAIAHCTVFRLYGSLRSEDDFWRCVREVGTTTFDHHTCEGRGHFETWSRLCAAGEADCHALPPRAAVAPAPVLPVQTVTP